MVAVRIGVFHRPAPAEPPGPTGAPQAEAGRGPPPPLPHDQLGLFSSDAITVRARVGRGAPALLRPPESGLAYDLAPDDGTGLAAGSRVLTARGGGARRAADALGRSARATRPAPGTPSADRPPDGAGPRHGRPRADRGGRARRRLPRRAVLLAPDNLLFLPDFLPDPVAARALVDDGIARREDTDESAEYFHVAPDARPGAGDGDVLLVDGLPVGPRALP